VPHLDPALAAPADHPALDGLAVLERGWLSSNNIVLPAAADEPGATVIDTGHTKHAAQTVALVEHRLQGRPLARIVNTHLHSDHCGGNAALQRRFGARLAIPSGQAADVRAWDESRLSHHATGQWLERFTPQDELRPGTVLAAGPCRFEVLAAPGHDPHSLMLFEPRRGLLLSADALWGNGFGVVFPEIAGEPGFGDVAATLDLIAALPVRCVVPGHGAPFTDVEAALGRARSRLEAFRREPRRHARHAAKVLLKYRLMEQERLRYSVLRDWAVHTPLMQGLHRELSGAGGSPEAFVESLLAELCAAGVVRREMPEVGSADGWVCDGG
jgi:glyoxylase-like metal-dependent hydrolase (beta-lactamase superfamily II)